MNSRIWALEKQRMAADSARMASYVESLHLRRPATTQDSLTATHHAGTMQPPGGSVTSPVPGAPDLDTVAATVAAATSRHAAAVSSGAGIRTSPTQSLQVRDSEPGRYATSSAFQPCTQDISIRAHTGAYGLSRRIEC